MVEIELGSVTADVVFKDIKNVHLSVHPPDGRVTIAAPSRMELETVRMFSASKLDWIKQQQRVLREQPRETPREYLEAESHFVWGKRYLLSVAVTTGPVGVDMDASKLTLRVRQASSDERRADIMASWYRDQIREAIEPLLEKWGPRLGVSPAKVFVQHMKTMWGSCNQNSGNIRLNTELAKKPPECLEYILVHELIHLIEPTHNDRFMQLMTDSLPNWRTLRRRLNELPVKHEDWQY